MGFVKSAEEIAGIERALSAPRFVRGERLTVSFLTDPATYARLLPAPLEPAAQPLVIAGIGRWQSNCVGDYAGGSISLAAGHRGVHGAYAIAMWMDSEPAVVFGRDLFGEPKKLAASGLIHEGDVARAWIERNGVRLVELEADLDPDLGPSSSERVAYNIRSRTAPGGVGLDGPALLTAATFTATIGLRREGRGRIALQGTAHDPVDELEVSAIVGAEYQQHDLAASCTAVATIPAEDFLPYHHGRADDYALLDTAGHHSSSAATS